MNKLLIALALFTMTLHAATTITKTPQVRLEWDAPADTDIKGYRVYWGTVSGIYTNSVDIEAVALPGVPPTDSLIKDLTPRVTYYFAVTAYSTALLESLPSNEVSWTAPKVPGKPTNLRVGIAQNSLGERKIQISLVNKVSKRVVSTEDEEALNTTDLAPNI